ncbi:hypothetical protein [Paludisphaera rhizosphaerae]|uniref:hypothetical protein n=1 Tax=Paludisphaera rhizosphaerae TaxID=2711216 RepID=UPI0013E9ACBB|nr:hypothetical protein [Paludisphaera rhizosphaerae]
MAKKKGPTSAQVRVAQDVAELAAIVAAFERRMAVDVMSEILRPVLQERYAQHVAAEAAKLSGPESPDAPPKPRKGKA